MHVMLAEELYFHLKLTESLKGGAWDWDETELELAFTEKHAKFRPDTQCMECVV